VTCNNQIKRQENKKKHTTVHECLVNARKLILVSVVVLKIVSLVLLFNAFPDCLFPLSSIL